jgi:hypothetical protein
LGRTVTGAEPDTFSAVATIFAVPTATAVTVPVAETEATAALLELHVTTRSVRELPAASRTVAVAGVVCPSESVDVPSATPTDATGRRTDSVALPTTPSLMAVIRLVPADMAVTIPVGATFATVVSLDDQVTLRPESMLFDESRITATACVVWPTKTGFAVNVTETLATGTERTVTAAWPVCPSLAAEMVAIPGAMPVTTPESDTVATV